MTPILALLRLGDDTTRPILIEPCDDGSDEWRVVDDDESLNQTRRWHCHHEREKKNETQQIRR